MNTPFGRLRDRVGTLGNHHRKYLRTVAAHKEKLIRRLENRGVIDEVSLWKPSTRLNEELGIIGEVANSEEQRLDFLGTYYALQFLQMNLQQVDVLRLAVSDADRPRSTVYRDFMLTTGARFRDMTAAYMRRLLDVFAPEHEKMEFVLTSVGTRSDQDDIDVGIVDDGSPTRKELNRAVARVSAEMLRHASRLHLYLSEHVGEQQYTASIAEYEAVLEEKATNFVFVTEVLGAARVMGSQRLFGEFTERVVERFIYSRDGRDNRCHEAYLRGLLGELRSLIVTEPSTDTINPKDDGLRLLKGAISVAKAVFGLAPVNAWHILDAVEERDPRRADLYRRMRDALSFLEIFRFLYQLLNVQEEDIYLRDEVSVAVLDDVAHSMGYEDVGVILARQKLLVDYYAHVAEVKSTVGDLLEDARRHIRAVSAFRPYLRLGSDGKVEREGGDPGLLLDFSREAAFFRGTSFFEDVIDDLEAEGGVLLRRLAVDAELLDPETRRHVVRLYASTGHHTLLTALQVLLALAGQETDPACIRLFEELNAGFLEQAPKFENVVFRFTEVLKQSPGLLHSYMSHLSEEHLHRLEELMGGEVWDPKVKERRDQILRLCRLHYENSHYFRRFFHKVVDRHPELIADLANDARLAEIAKGLYGQVTSLASIRAQKETLGDYYDLEFLRVGLLALSGTAAEQVDMQFTEFVDTYLETLFSVCKQDVSRALGRSVPTRDLLGIFVAGSHAREQAFDDDYDLFVLLNSDDKELRDYCCRIVARMNTEIRKRGTLPQYRFADHTGQYVSTLREIRDFLDSEPHAFVDRSQLLGARMIVGSQGLERAFEKEIVEPFVFAASDVYVRDIVEDMRARRAQSQESRDGINVKNAPGGLRDIELALLMLKARFGLREPINKKLVQMLYIIDEDHASDVLRLGDAMRSLKRLRNLYRLSFTAGDTVPASAFPRLAALMGSYQDLSSEQAGEKLHEEIRSQLHKARVTVDHIIADLER